jgi:hypothetical protein
MLNTCNTIASNTANNAAGKLPTTDSNSGDDDVNAEKKPTTDITSSNPATTQPAQGRGITAGIKHSNTGTARTGITDHPK